LSFRGFRRTRYVCTVSANQLPAFPAANKGAGGLAMILGRPLVRWDLRAVMCAGPSLPRARQRGCSGQAKPAAPDETSTYMFSLSACP
jgi:hypothetical protein